MRSLTIRLTLATIAIALSPGRALAGDEAHPAGEPDARRMNRPPKLGYSLEVRPSMPDGGGVLRVGRATRAAVTAEDPDGDALSYALEPLPAGSTFDRAHGVLTWRPTREQEGRHELRIQVADGQLVAERVYLVTVLANRAPRGMDESTIRLSAGKPGQMRADHGDGNATYLAKDPDGDPLTFEIRKLPPGARVENRNETVYFLWKPTAAQLGEHELEVEISDGELSTTVHAMVVAFPEWATHDYHGWLLPGGGPSGFLSHGDGETFVGGAFDVTVFARMQSGVDSYGCAHQTTYRDCHASHHRFYAEFEVLDSLRAGAPSLFTYGGGYSASLETNPGRRYLIPHYGVEVGGLVRSGLGHRAQTRPYLGLHLYSGDDVWINAAFGYRVVPTELRDLSGPTFTLRANFNPW